MKKIILIAATLLVAGCGTTTVPVKRTFPDAPPALMEPAAPLKTLEPNSRLSRVVETSVENMSAYHVLAEKYLAWQDWYKTQRQIFESVDK